MFRKIESWIVGLIVLFFILIIIVIAGVLRDAYLGKNKTPEFLRENFKTVAEFPANILHVSNFFLNRNAPPKLQKHKDKKKFKQFVENKRNALLILPRYEHSLNRSLVEIIDLNNFEVIHTYNHNIDQMIDEVKNIAEFPRLKIDNSPVRFEYQHPLLLNDGSFVSIFGPAYKIDFCSNLQWINDEEIFSHSQMLDHEGKIWVRGKMNPNSKYVKKFLINDYLDDSIFKINTDGKIIFSKSVTEILIENKLIDKNILYSGTDPIHLNDIEPAFSDTEHWKQGDLFLSLRNLSSIIHYRPTTNEVINYITGPFAQQHDVDIISRNEISIFNNNNFLVNNQNSEVLIYDFKSKKFKNLFNEQLQKENLKTLTGGLSHIFNDGALMVEEQNHGRIILFNNSGEKEWEFVNKDKNGDIGLISWSRIIEDELFIEKFKSLVKSNECLK